MSDYVDTVDIEGTQYDIHDTLIREIINRLVPSGSIMPYGGEIAPEKWLLCHGQAISRTEYASLFNAIGTRFGAGDGSTTFNVPDLRGEFLRGAGTNSHSGQGNGGAVGAHQDATKQLVFSVFGGQLYFEPNAMQDNFDAIEYGPVYQYLQNEAGHSGSQNIYSAIKSRPTNTSVNFIIKL